MATKNGQRRILVINDTPEILDLFCDILQEEGYYQLTADSFPLNTTASWPRSRRIAPI